MEYCEEGDLAYHIKKMREKKQHFSEDLIQNWFLQIAFALSYIHSKKILHRDIKASNIFLTSLGFVKLGDFGISKILEGTMDNADTVIGTPYYMSPEVCENIPYSYKSDVWALGCVLYELCTLKHAFSASNLLGLVYKIIQEKQEPIPDIYSNNMKTLVSSLLTKDHKKRPDIAAIFKFDFVQDIAKSFVDKKGEVKQGDFVPVIKRTEVHLEKDLQEMGGKNITNMTPKEKMEMKKRLEAEKNKEKMTQAIMENRSGMAGTKDRRQKEMMSSMDTFKYSTTAKAVKPSPVVSQVVEGGKMSSSQMDKSREFYGEGTLESKYEMTKPSKKPMDQTYKDLPTQTINTMNLDTQKLGGKPGSQVQNVSQSPSRGHQDDRPIKASGQYNIGGYQNSRFDDGDDEAAIMGDTLQTMEMTKVNRRDLKKKPDGEFETLKTQEIYDQKLNEKVHDDFPADFEDTGEPAAEIDDLYEADEPSCRLTQKQGQKELKDVLDEYKKFVKKPDEFQMANSSHFSELPTIKETKNESGTTGHSSANHSNASTPKIDRNISTKSERIEISRTNLIKELGQSVYDDVYKYLSYHRKKNTPDDKIQQHLRANYDKKVLSKIFEIDQLVFLESSLK